MEKNSVNVVQLTEKELQGQFESFYAGTLMDFEKYPNSYIYVNNITRACFNPFFMYAKLNNIVKGE